MCCLIQLGESMVESVPQKTNNDGKTDRQTRQKDIEISERARERVSSPTLQGVERVGPQSNHRSQPATFPNQHAKRTPELTRHEPATGTKLEPATSIEQSNNRAIEASNIVSLDVFLDVSAPIQRYIQRYIHFGSHVAPLGGFNGI